MFEVIYVPRIQDEVTVARFETQAEADAWMEEIKAMRPKAYPHHYVKEVK